MRNSKALCAAMVMIVGAAAAGTAAAHGGVRFGFNFGFPAWYPAPYYYPAPVYYYPPPVVVAPAAPPVYIERGEARPAPTESYWYYCPDSKTYYPYVQNCASAWQRVVPRPPG